MQELVLPALGMAPGDVYIAQWLVPAGAEVTAGEPVVLVETDKAELSVEAVVDGVLGEHLVAEGESAPAGATIAWILQPGDAVPGAEANALTHEAASDTAGPRDRTERVRDAVSRELTPYTESPRARAGTMAAQDPVGLGKVDEGPLVDRPHTDAEVVSRTSVSNVLAPDELGSSAEAANRYRTAIAKAVSRSWVEIPHFAATRVIRSEQLHLALRSMRVLSSAVTFTDILLKAYALALVERFDTFDINLGLAVATPHGVAIPVISSAATADVPTIAKLRSAAVARALAGQAILVDHSAPHSTLSNLGQYGVDSFTGIIPVGQSSILTVGSSVRRPVVDEGAITAGYTVSMTLNVDHRIWDGEHAALVLQRLAAVAAEPTLLLNVRAS